MSAEFFGTDPAILWGWRTGLESAIQRGVVTAQDAGGLAHRGAFGEEALPERDLLGAQHRRTAETHALFLRGAPAGVGAFGDERALELGDPGEHGQNPLAGGRGRVGPRLGQRPQAGAGAVEALREVEQIAGRAGQAIQASGHDDISLAEMVEQSRQFGAVAAGARDFLFVQAMTAGGAQGGALVVELLVVGGDAGVTDQQGEKSQKSVA